MTECDQPEGKAGHGPIGIASHPRPPFEADERVRCTQMRGNWTKGCSLGLPHVICRRNLRDFCVLSFPRLEEPSLFLSSVSALRSPDRARNRKCPSTGYRAGTEGLEIQPGTVPSALLLLLVASACFSSKPLSDSYEPVARAARAQPERSRRRPAASFETVPVPRAGGTTSRRRALSPPRRGCVG